MRLALACLKLSKNIDAGSQKPCGQTSRSL
jgi:hypothetical protein